MSAISEWQWNPQTDTFDYWHETSNLIVRVWEVEPGSWGWEILEFTDTDADPLVVADWEADMPIPFVSKEAAQTAALEWFNHG